MVSLKTEKVNTTIEFSIFELILVLNVSWNWQFICFGPTLPKKCFPSRTQKVKTTIESHHTGINLGSEFQLKLTVVIFWTIFEQKVCFPSKIEKVKTTIEFCIFKLVLVPNFRWNWQFWPFFQKFVQKVCFPSKSGKVNTATDICTIEVV